MSTRAGSNRVVGAANPLDVAIVDGSGSQITSFGGGSGGTAAQDDAAFSIGSAGSITPAGFLADETATDSVDEGDVGVARMTLARKQLMVLSDQNSETHADVLALAGFHPIATAIVDGNGDQITSFGGGTQYVEDAAAAANPTGTALNLVRDDARGGSLVSTDGDNIAARGTNAGELYVKHVDAIPITDNSGSLTVDGTVTANQGTAGTAWEVVGDIAHDAAGAAINPLLMGAYASAAAPSDVSADADAVRIWALRSGAQAIQPTFAGVLGVAGNGASGTGVQRVTIANDSTGTVAVTQGTASSLNATIVGTGTLAVQATVAAGATTIGKAEDAAHSSSDVGVFALAVRNDAAGTTFTSTDGDYSPIAVDSKGSVAVNDGGNSITVDYAQTGSGTATGALRVELANNGTGTLATVSTVSTVTSVTAIATSVTPGTAAGHLGKAEDAAHSSGDTGVMMLAVREAAVTDLSAGNTDGDYEPLQVDASGRLWTHPADSVAHDAVDAGNGLKVTAKAVSATSGVTLVSSADRTDLFADLDGTLLSRNQVPLGDLLSVRVSNTDGADTAFTVFDNAAGKRNYITSVTVHNAHASTNGFVDLKDGVGGAILWTFPLPATGGATHNFNPPLRQTSAATALSFDVSAAISTIYLSVNGFKSKL